MNLLQITHTKVYPPTQGGERRSHGLTLAFQEGNNQTIRYCVGGPLSNHPLPKIQKEININENYKEVRPVNPLYDIPSIPPAIFNVPGTLVNQILDYMPTRELRSLIEWSDVIITQGPHLVLPIVKLSDNSPVVFSSHNVEVDRWEKSSNSYIGRYFFEELYENEKYALEQSDAIICVSESDKQRYKKLFPTPSPIWTIPNGTSRKNLDPSPKSETHHLKDCYGIKPNNRVAVFVGSDYGPNISAVDEILQFAKRAEQENRPIHFLVAGTVCKHFKEKYSTLTLTGFVEDIEDIYTAGDIGLNPITEGAGSNVKVIEYMAHSLPTITTPFGARGYNLTDGKDVLIRDIDRFYNTICDVDDGLLREVGINGQMTVRKQYTWEKLSRSLFRNLEKII